MVSLAQRPQLHGLIPRGDGDAASAIGAEQRERIARMKGITVATDTLFLNAMAMVAHFGPPDFFITGTDEPPALLDENGNEDAPVSEPDFIVTLPQAGVHYNYALDSLYENDMHESVPVAPGEQSLYEQAVAAARALAASRARELSHKRKQRGSAPPAAIAVASWRRYS